MLWTIFIFNELKRYQRPDIKGNDQRYQLVRRYDVSKTQVSFRYQFNCLCDVLRWSVSSWYIATTSQVGRFYWRTQWEVAKTSQIGLSYWRTSWDVVMIPQHGLVRSNWSLKWVNFFLVIGSTLLRHLRWVILIKIPASTLQQRLKDVYLIYVLTETSLRRVKLVSLA